MSNLDITKIRLPIALVACLFVQFFGIIWYISQLDSTVNSVQKSVQELKKGTTVAVLESKIDYIENRIKQLDAQIVELKTEMDDNTGTSFSLFGKK
jgi:septal ring factor EnvC (AmiA/AmiB activator)